MTRLPPSAFLPRGKKLIGDAIENAFPVADSFLAEEPQRGIPRTVIAVLQPAPVGHRRNGDPSAHAQRSGEMANGRVAGDHQIKTLDTGVQKTFQPSVRCGARLDGVRCGGRCVTVAGEWRFDESNQVGAF